MEPAIKELLHRRADDIRLPMEIPPVTLRRSRRRRGLTAVVGSLTTMAFIAGTVVALQSTVFSSGRLIGATPTPASPTETNPPAEDDLAVPAIWPETNHADVASEQQRVDAGDDLFRTDPVETARFFARSVLGWTTSLTVTLQSSDEAAGTAAVTAVPVDPGFEGIAIGVDITLAQIGVRGRDGIWSVDGVAPGFRPPGIDLSCGTDPLVPGAPATLCGTLSPVLAGERVAYAIFDGDRFDMASFGDAPDHGTLVVDRRTHRFRISIAGPVSGTASLLVIEVLQGDGRVSSMLTERLSRRQAPVISEPVSVELSPAAASLRDRIQAAADATNFNGLGDLIDPATFHFQVDGAPPGTDVRAAAIIYWKERGPEVARTLSLLLDMPYAVEHGEVDTYVWPAVVDYDHEQLVDLAPEWQQALAMLYPDFNRRWKDDWLQHGYDGWRVTITADGRWLSFSDG